MRPCHFRVFPGSFKAGYLLSAAAAVLLSACSSSMERFADNPWDSDPVYTASVPKEPSEENQDSRVTSRPLNSAAMKPAVSGNSYASNGYNYQRQQGQANGQMNSAQMVANQSGQVRIEPGMTLYSVARANGLTVAELATANGISAPYAVHTGQMITVPTRGQIAKAPTGFQTAVAKTEPTYEAPQPKKAAGAGHTVRPGETLFSLGRTYGVSPYAIADLNRLPHSATLQTGQVVQIPGGQGATRIAAAEPAVPAITTSETIATKDVSRIDAPKPVTAEEIPLASPTEPDVQTAQAPAPQPAAEPGTGGMRWPVKGKVISEFGSKPNGLRNEGINIAVPEGTSVRAADSGIVAYAGNELKGYGNLVLIRHEGGWVTAYAHNKELFVQRGDTVKRGDVIAKAGQTGSVSTPQLHFEVRKGATAMDPMKFLGPVTAAN
jgi:murein DD-endopeptidase MepM/ murein hydrolase activator NlpD